MSGVLERAVQFFVAPAAPRRAAAVAPATRAVVLGRAGEAVPLGAAVALALRAAERAPAALVAVWGADAVARGAASRPAARLAGRVGAGARGRLAWLALPSDPAEAAEAVRQVSALVDGPLVTALAGARPPELDLLVAEHDLAVLAADPAAPLARTAIAALAGQGVLAAACPPLRRGARRTLALAGLAAPPLDIPLAGREAA